MSVQDLKRAEDQLTCAEEFSQQLLDTLDEMSNDERWNPSVRLAIMTQQIFQLLQSECKAVTR